VSGPTNPGATWNQRYAGDDYLFGTEPNHWLSQHAALLPPRGRVLCVADGEGRNGVWLARQGHAVQAFDIAPRALAKAARLAAQQGVAVDLVQAGCDDFAWPDGTFDAVVAIFVQFATPAERTRLFERMARALRPGGVLMLLGYTPKQLEYRTGGPPWVEHLYTDALLREAFAGLEILQLKAFEDEIHEGTGHAGRSALIGLVARRPD
jgi:SAM-dependent methyltransferase